MPNLGYFQKPTIWLAFNIFWDFWANEQKKICAWVKKKKNRLTSFLLRIVQLYD